MWVTMMAVPALKGTAELFEGDIFKPLASNSKDQKSHGEILE